MAPRILRFAKSVAIAILCGALDAGAQGVAFSTSSLPRQMRLEGINETAGEVVLVPFNSGTILAGSTIDIVYSAAITNNSTFSTNNISKANNIFCSPAGSCPSQASLLGTNVVRLVFASNTPFGIGDSINVSRVRVNVNTAAGLGTVTASFGASSSNAATNPITFSDPVRQVGVLGNSLSASAPSFIYLPTCNFPNTAPATLTFRVSELFPAAFTTIVQEAVFSNAQTVSNGVSFRVTINNVPSGITVAGPSAPFNGLANENSNLLQLSPTGADHI